MVIDLKTFRNHFIISDKWTEKIPSCRRKQQEIKNIPKWAVRANMDKMWSRSQL